MLRSATPRCPLLSGANTNDTLSPTRNDVGVQPENRTSSSTCSAACVVSRCPHAPLLLPIRAKGRNLHVKQIARDLRVATLLEGSVRGSGSRVRVSVQLVDANSGYHMWSQTFDRASHDIFVLQDELARSIVDALATHLGIELPALEHRSPPTLNVSAYHCYLQARALQTRSNEQSLRSAITLHREAIGQDPAFARAYSGAAAANLAPAGMAFSFDHTLSEAEHDSRRALSLDPGLAEAHAVLGALFCWRAQLLNAEMCLRTARFLDPTDANVLTMHAILVTAAVGHMQKTQRELCAAYEMAPAHPGGLIALAFLGLQFGKNSEALRFVELAAGLGFASNALPLPFIRSQVAWRAGDYAQAALHASATFAREPDSGLVGKLIESVFQGTVDSANAQAASRDLRRLALDPMTRILDPIRYPRPLLVWATLLGDLDLAYAIAGCVLEEFERSGVLKVAAGFCNQFWQPEMRPFRHDSRFQKLAGQLGLAEFWEVHGPPDPE